MVDIAHIDNILCISDDHVSSHQFSLLAQNVVVACSCEWLSVEWIHLITMCVNVQTCKDLSHLFLPPLPPSLSSSPTSVNGV